MVAGGGVAGGLLLLLVFPGLTPLSPLQLAVGALVTALLTVRVALALR